MGLSLGIGIGVSASNAATAANRIAGKSASYYYTSSNGIGESNLELNNEGLPILNNGNIRQAILDYENGLLEDVELWDVSGVTNMSEVFFQTNFNSDISNWDVSNVTNMYSMFRRTSSFNQDISSWDVSSVTDMGLMFDTSRTFNQDLSSWDVSNVASSISFSSGASSWTLPKPSF